jgi:hypothetical protein
MGRQSRDRDSWLDRYSTVRGREGVLGLIAGVLAGEGDVVGQGIQDLEWGMYHSLWYIWDIHMLYTA